MVGGRVVVASVVDAASGETVFDTTNIGARSDKAVIMKGYDGSSPQVNNGREAGGGGGVRGVGVV